MVHKSNLKLKVHNIIMDAIIDTMTRGDYTSTVGTTTKYRDEIMEIIKDCAKDAYLDGVRDSIQ